MTDEQRKLVNDNMNLVPFVLNKYYPSQVKNEDLKQVGYVGLCKSVMSYNEDLGKFSTYAVIKIRGEVSNHLKKVNRETNNLGDFISLDIDLESYHPLYEVIPAQVYFDNEKYEYLTCFMESQTDFDRTILEKLYQGYTKKEIAAYLDTSVMTINRHLKKLKDGLHSYLNKEC